MGYKKNIQIDTVALKRWSALQEYLMDEARTPEELKELLEEEMGGRRRLEFVRRIFYRMNRIKRAKDWAVLESQFKEEIKND